MPPVILLALAGCIETGLSSEKDAPADSSADTATETGMDTAADTAETADTAPETADTAPETAETAETADTSVDTAETADTSVDTGPPPDTDTGEPPDKKEPPINAYGTCTSGYPYTSWSDPSATEPELNVVGVYESQAGTGGPVTVTVGRTSDMILALTSYSKVEWRIDLDAAHNVSEILISSYEPITYTFIGAGTAPVNYVGWIGECGYEIPDMDPMSGCETPDLQVAVERYTGLAMSSFQGCYAGGDYVID